MQLIRTGVIDSRGTLHKSIALFTALTLESIWIFLREFHDLDFIFICSTSRIIIKIAISHRLISATSYLVIFTSATAFFVMIGNLIDHSQTSLVFKLILVEHKEASLFLNILDSFQATFKRAWPIEIIFTFFVFFDYVCLFNSDLDKIGIILPFPFFFLRALFLATIGFYVQFRFLHKFTICW